MDKRICITMLLGWLLSCGQVAAQQEGLGANVLTYGDFETGQVGQAPMGWAERSGRTLEYELVEGSRPSGVGSKVLRVVTTSRVWFKSYFAGKDNYISITPGQKYILSFWHKAIEAPGQDIRMLVKWYDEGEDYYTRQMIYPNALPTSALVSNADKERVTQSMQTEDDWKLAWIPIEPPRNVMRSTSVSVEVVALGAEGKGFLLDDIELRPVLTPSFPKAPELSRGPSAVLGLRGKAYQREIELTWEPNPEEGVSWEVSLSGNTWQTREPRYTIEGLEPDRDYTIEVKAVKDGEYSRPAEYQGHTTPMRYSTDDVERIPYLRTISPAGFSDQVIALYYEDLANLEASISYWIDGEPVAPQEGKLSFPSKGTHKLKVRIEEAPDRIWELEYRVVVR